MRRKRPFLATFSRAVMAEKPLGQGDCECMSESGAGSSRGYFQAGFQLSERGLPLAIFLSINASESAASGMSDSPRVA